MDGGPTAPARHGAVLHEVVADLVYAVAQLNNAVQHMRADMIALQALITALRAEDRAVFERVQAELQLRDAEASQALNKIFSECVEMLERLGGPGGRA